MRLCISFQRLCFCGCFFLLPFSLFEEPMSLWCWLYSLVHVTIGGDVLCRRNTNRQRAEDQLNRLKDQLTLQQFLQECDEVGTLVTLMLPPSSACLLILLKTQFIHLKENQSKNTNGPEKYRKCALFICRLHLVVLYIYRSIFSFWRAVFSDFICFQKLIFKNQD